jgi:hypothetical protein
MELNHGSEESETPPLQNVSAAPNFDELIWPIRRPRKMVKKPVQTVIIIEMRRNQVIKKKLNRIRQ